MSDMYEKYHEALFWSNVSVGKRTDCWEWKGYKEPRGYGRLSRGGILAGRSLKAHRVAWELFNGQVEGGLHVLHRCNNPPCCNPYHLYLGTHQDNMRDALNDGLFVRGEARADTKITEEIVRGIRSKFVPRVHGIGILAQEFGVSKATVRNVVYKLAWRWVK